MEVSIGEEADFPDNAAVRAGSAGGAATSAQDRGPGWELKPIAVLAIELTFPSATGPGIPGRGVGQGPGILPVGGGEGPGTVSYQALCGLALGAARREPPQSASAAAHYRQALALAEALGMRPLQAHCHLGLGTLYAKAGQQERARTALSTAITMYRAMEMTFWIPPARAVLGME